MKLRVIVLGAGFGGLELSSILSEKLGDRLELTLIDKNDSFYFGFSKLDVMFGKALPSDVKHGYGQIRKKGVVFIRDMVTSIDPVAKTVTTVQGSYEGDVIVVAMGAEYDKSATPGLEEIGHEFYTMAGAEKIRDLLPKFNSGHIIVGVSSAPFKCPPAPSEAALMLHDYLIKRGIRNDSRISLIIPFPVPIPPSPESSKVLMRSFEERDIHFIPNRSVARLDAIEKTAVLDDGTAIPFDLFIGIPKHIAPKMVVESGLTENGWIPVDRKDLRTRYPDVYAVGDITSVGTPKAGTFAEGAARIAAEAIIAKFEGRYYSESYNGSGACYLEFGEGKVSRVDVDFFSGPKPVAIHNEASMALKTDKELFGSERVKKWFRE